MTGRSTPGTIEVWLIRHGRTPWNVDRRFQGHTDVPLDDVGREQAETLRTTLATTAFDGVWSSDLSRAVETARIALRPPTQDVRLRELDFGEMEGLRWDELDDAVRAQLLGDATTFHAPGGESFRSLATRVAAFLDELTPGRHAVVAHGGVVRVAAAACGLDGFFPGHAEVVTVDWGGRSLLEP